MSKETRSYETIFILDPLLDDGKIDSITAKYTDFLTKEGCTITKTDKWGRKKFAYPIRKLLTGYFVSIEFQGNPEVIAKLEKVYHLDENILRHLTNHFDKKTLTERQKYFEKKESEAAFREREAAAREEESRAAADVEVEAEATEKV